ncbi:unnamed protein product [Cunninghamella echinulata]
MLVYLVSTVSAGCCNIFDTNCCGRCLDGQYAGQTCDTHGNAHTLKCGYSYPSPFCMNYEKGDCDIGWKC